MGTENTNTGQMDGKRNETLNRARLKRRNKKQPVPIQLNRHPESVCCCDISLDVHYTQETCANTRCVQQRKLWEKAISRSSVFLQALPTPASDCFLAGSIEIRDQHQQTSLGLSESPLGSTTRQPKEGEVPGVDYNFVSVERFMELEQSGALLESGTYEDNFYGTPKPPAEPSPAAPPLNVSEALLPGARPSAQGKRKRNQSVSNMEQRASLEPPEEEEEESPVVNGNGVAITPDAALPPRLPLSPGASQFCGGSALTHHTPKSSEHEDKSTDASGEVAAEGSSQAPASSEPPTEGEEAPKSPSKSPSKVPDVDEEELGPLPDNWEMAYTEKGEVYFIDHSLTSVCTFFPTLYYLHLRLTSSHNTKTTSWLDPRLAKKAKPPEECREDGFCAPSADNQVLDDTSYPLTAHPWNPTLSERLGGRRQETETRRSPQLKQGKREGEKKDFHCWFPWKLSPVQFRGRASSKRIKLPYGWEKIDDPIYGSYYVDHINRRTQFENPVLEAKRRLDQQRQMQSQGLSALPLPTIYREKPLFTRDPTQLKGTFLSTALQKSNMGFGFTIIGGDEPDEFLQVKSVIPDGPAAQDGKMDTVLKCLSLSSAVDHRQQQAGDVIVYINDICVLGTTHADVVKLFQSVPIGQSVTLVLCRGYPLPFDPEDPNAAASASLTPIGLEHRPLVVNGRGSYDPYLEYLSLSSQLPPQALAQAGASHPGDTHLDGSSLPPTTPGSASAHTPRDDNVSMASSGAAGVAGATGQGPELLTVTMVKGAEGFGFTIADSPTGQRVKQLLRINDAFQASDGGCVAAGVQVLEPGSQGASGLIEGDLILEVNQQPVASAGHGRVVEMLKECPVGAEATLLIQRAGTAWALCQRSAELWSCSQLRPQTSQPKSEPTTYLKRFAPPIRMRLEAEWKEKEPSCSNQSERT
ncbi:hypothetical protein CCH79_00012350 [Gambusia affinis]|uniref:Membrane-associated guanylate kinase, WW and PDZ domain-containing protein 2 n=1 Tax=Gambusia affinis TaxID=33528 RepID=A0A315UTU4_GAMAF|nr:hypothetical protein CCH79_00012350 [Gambusia affinis]